MDLFSVMLGKKLGGGGSAPTSKKNIEFAYIKDETGEEFRTIPSGFIEIDIPEGYTTFYDPTSAYGVGRMKNLKILTIPSTFTTISDVALGLCTALEKIIINKPEGSIAGAPWGAPATCEVIWNG